jgi:hypothetical protein
VIAVEVLRSRLDTGEGDVMRLITAVVLAARQRIVASLVGAAVSRESLRP